MPGQRKHSPTHDDPQRSVRILLIAGIAAGLALPLVLRSCFSKEPPQIDCASLCQGTYIHCAFKDHTLCLRECASTDLRCRTRCSAREADCAAHCSAVKSMGCERYLKKLYACLLVRCANPERDLWRECADALTAYEQCLEPERTPPSVGSEGEG